MGQMAPSVTLHGYSPHECSLPPLTAPADKHDDGEHPFNLTVANEYHPETPDQAGLVEFISSIQESMFEREDKDKEFPWTVKRPVVARPKGFKDRNNAKGKGKEQSAFEEEMEEMVDPEDELGWTYESNGTCSACQAVLPESRWARFSGDIKSKGRSKAAKITSKSSTRASRSSTKTDNAIESSGSGNGSAAEGRLSRELLGRVLDSLDPLESSGIAALACALRVSRSWYVEVIPRIYRDWTCTAHDLAALVGLGDKNPVRSVGKLKAAGQETRKREEDVEEEGERHPIEWSQSRRQRWILGFVERLTYRPVERYSGPVPPQDQNLHSMVPALRDMVIDLSSYTPSRLSDVSDVSDVSDGLSDVSDGSNGSDESEALWKREEMMPMQSLFDFLGDDLRAQHVCYTPADRRCSMSMSGEGGLELVGKIAPSVTLRRQSQYGSWDLDLTAPAAPADDAIGFVDPGVTYDNGKRRHTHSFTIAHSEEDGDNVDVPCLEQVYFVGEMFDHRFCLNDPKTSFPWEIRHAELARPPGFVDRSVDNADKSEDQMSFEDELTGHTGLDTEEVKAGFSYSTESSDKCSACHARLPEMRWCRLTGWILDEGK